MRRKSWLAIPALLALIAAPIMAGGDHKCTMATQACLDQMAANMKNKGWLGIETDHKAEGQPSITRVVAGSPAEAAGFKVGDVLVAINGVKLSSENEEAIKAAKKGMVPGKQVVHTVLRNGSEVKLTATLATLPREVLAQWVGNHMLEHSANTAIAQN